MHHEFLIDYIATFMQMYFFLGVSLVKNGKIVLMFEFIIFLNLKFLVSLYAYIDKLFLDT